MTKEVAQETARALIENRDVGPVLADVLSALIDDPPAKIDTTLRGWVIANEEVVYWAAVDGLCETVRDPSGPTWEAVEEEGWTVRRLTPEDIGYRVRKWDEWSEEERIEFARAQEESVFNRDVVTIAIDIATRGDA